MDNIINMDDNTIRQGIRSSMHLWLEKLRCGGDVVKQHEYRQKFLDKIANSPVSLGNKESKEQHYEVPTEFFKLVLGPQLKYSANLHELALNDNDDDLAAAEERCLSCICERAQISDGMQVMDMGCGWGALSLYVLRRFPRCRVTALSNSATQRAHIEAAAAAAGCQSRLSVVTSDIADFDTRRRFDRVVSVEMLEHTKNVGEVLRRVSGWLLPDGKLFTQILCHRSFSYNFDATRGAATEWMARNFFTGGSMFAADLFLYMQQHVQLQKMWLVNGRHYSRTLEAWLRRLDARRAEVEAVFCKTLRPEEAQEQIQNWRVFFIFCSEVFAYDGGNEWMVAHHLFCNRQLAAL